MQSTKLEDLAKLARINLDAYESEILSRHFSRLVDQTDKLKAFECDLEATDLLKELKPRE